MTSRSHAGLDWSGVLHDKGDMSTNGVYRGPRGTDGHQAHLHHLTTRTKSLAAPTTYITERSRNAVSVQMVVVVFAQPDLPSHTAKGLE